MRNLEMTWRMTYSDQQEVQPVWTRLLLPTVDPRVDLLLMNGNAVVKRLSFVDDPLIQRKVWYVIKKLIPNSLILVYLDF